MAKKWDWKTFVIIAVAVVICDCVERWIVVYYSIPRFESFALSFLLLLLVMLGLTALRRKLGI